MTELGTTTIGFIGLGVMGGPMCANLASKHTGPVHAFDTNAEALAVAAQNGALAAGSVAELATACDVILLSLPSGVQVRDVCLGPDGITGSGSAGLTVIDLSTTSVADARSVASELAEHGIEFADAPVARTREAARNGTLSIMVGASQPLFERIEPLLRHMGSDVTHCGEVGCGQVVKLVNNTLVFTHTAVLAEMMVTAERAGVDAGTLLDAVSKGSGDSFVLRNHGRKSMAPREFPDNAFPSTYVLKDIGYSIELAREFGVDPQLAEVAQAYYRSVVDAGLGDKYFPVVAKLIREQS